MRKDNERMITKNLKGPTVLVGPALIYQDDYISVMIVSGSPGGYGKLHEIVLGRYQPESSIPDILAAAADTIMEVREAGCCTITEARGDRREIIEVLRKTVDDVQVFDDDLGLATTYAALFPSPKSKDVLAKVLAEVGTVQ